jgi:transposase InsO family protein
VRRRAATRQNAFDTLCSTSGIEHGLTPPRSPQINGMVERFNGRIKDITMFDQAKIWERRRTAVSGFQPHVCTIILRL